MVGRDRTDLTGAQTGAPNEHEVSPKDNREWTNICSNGMVVSRRVYAVRRVIDPFSDRSCVTMSVFEKMLEVTVTTGTIKKVVADRGFGFITAVDAKEYFFHRNSLDSTLNFDQLVGGESVEFEIEQSDKGPRAARVHAA
jgi:cold shock protein